MPVLGGDGDVVVGLGEVEFGEDLGPPDVIGERPQRWEREGVQGRPEVQQAEVATRPPASRGLGLEVEGGAPGGGLGQINRLHYSQVNKFLKRLFSFDRLFGSGL